MAITNSYGERINRTESTKNKPDILHYRKWRPVNVPELYRYLRILLFIGLRREPEHQKLWEVKGYNLGRYMALNRYE